MGRTRASSELSVKRPSGNLLSFSNMGNLVAHVVCCVAVQLLVTVLTASAAGYVQLPNPDTTPYAWETTSVYYLINFQYIVMACLFALGRPWKAWPWTNVLFSAWVVVTLLTSLLLCVAPTSSVFLFADDISMPISWRGSILGLALLSAAGNIGIELVGSPMLVQYFKRLALNRNVLQSGSVFGQVCFCFSCAILS